ncbi:hypothetical protein KGF54_000601 [Candida jiufengensis]|uniref:uncharacterized protein n=1 Tax=Candida jiufengensis TaxID=497108 RepID=UPI002224106D|nr:uncharacterized protein KGF54_000601 [Candida jiufengensis]KAI5956982.1 hypothetical protein KGF54_000601 [Candida jiufengensis]
MSDSKVNFNLFSNSSSSIIDEDIINKKDQTIEEQQQQPTQQSDTISSKTSSHSNKLNHDHNSSSISSNLSISSISSNSNDNNNNHHNHSTNTNKINFNSKPYNNNNHNNHNSNNKDEKFHKFVRKTIHKLKLSPAIQHHSQQQSSQQQLSTSPSFSASSAQPPPPSSSASTTTKSQSQQSQQSQQTQRDPIELSQSHPRFNSIVSCNSSSSDIFERSVLNFNNSQNNDSKSPFINLTNPETPFHYNIENYTSPILDTTTEILTNPNIKLDQVKLNCYCDNLNSFDDTLFNCSTTNNDNVNFNTSSFDSNNNNQKQCNQPQLESISPNIRPRARSIISQSIISTLDNSNLKHGNNKMNSSLGLTTITHTKSNNNFNTNNNNPKLHPSNYQTKRSSSFAGSTLHSRNKSLTNRDSFGGQQQQQDDFKSPTIDFFSYADIIKNEDENNFIKIEEEEFQDQSFNANDQQSRDDDNEIISFNQSNVGEMGFNTNSGNGGPSIRFNNLGGISSRRGSYATINAKDYIGVL